MKKIIFIIILIVVAVILSVISWSVIDEKFVADKLVIKTEEQPIPMKKNGEKISSALTQAGKAPPPETVADNSAPKVVESKYFEYSSKEDFFRKVKSDFLEARKGNATSALRLASITSNPYFRKTDSEPASLYGESLFSEENPDNSFYWLKIAADSGDLTGKVQYANLAASLKYLPKVYYSAIADSELSEIFRVSRAYIQEAVNLRSPDAVNILASAYAEGNLGVESNSIKSHACLIALAKMYPIPSVVQRVNASAKQFRAGDLLQAKSLSNNILTCQIT